MYKGFYVALERDQGVQIAEGEQSGEAKALEMTFPHDRAVLCV